MRFVVIKRATIRLFMLGIVAMLLASVNVFNNVSAAGLFFGNSVKKVPIYSVAEVESNVALSFDAAWGADKTMQIVTSLQDAKVKATFFLVGFWAEEHADVVKKIDEAGMEIGLHSNSHPDFVKLTAEQMENEIASDKAIIEKITGKTHNLFRFPFGSYNDTAISVCEKMGIIPIQWSVDSLDWKGLKTTDVINRIVGKAKGGDIVLMHNNSDHIEKVVPILLDRLSKKNLKPCAVGDIVLKENYTIDRQGIQRAKN